MEWLVQLFRMSSIVRSAEPQQPCQGRFSHFSLRTHELSFQMQMRTTLCTFKTIETVTLSSFPFVIS